MESRIHASFSLEIFSLSNSGLKTGPTKSGVPRSEKKIRIPPTHAQSWAFSLVFTYLYTLLLNAWAPPDFSISLINPPIKITNTITPAL